LFEIQTRHVLRRQKKEKKTQCAPGGSSNKTNKSVGRSVWPARLVQTCVAEREEDEPGEMVGADSGAEHRPLVVQPARHRPGVARAETKLHNLSTDDSRNGQNACFG
jgi:hypothetical protein